MNNFKIGDIVQFKDNPLDQDYANRFNLTGKLEVSCIKDGIAFFTGNKGDAALWRLELVEKASTNPFLKTETRTIEVNRPLHVGDIIQINRDYFITKTCDGICLSRFSSLMYIDDKDVDLLIKNLQLYKEAMQETSQ